MTEKQNLLDYFLLVLKCTIQKWCCLCFVFTLDSSLHLTMNVFVLKKSSSLCLSISVRNGENYNFRE